MADIYTLFRQIIGDSTPDYSVPDLNAFKYLDLGIDRMSSALKKTVIEDITISSADITAGYKDLSYEYVTINASELGLGSKGITWEEDGGKRISFIQPNEITAGTYEFRYFRKYKKFDGELRENSYFDYPRSMDLGIVFWALSEYQMINGIISVDNDALLMSRSEEGMSESYDNIGTLRLGSPKDCRYEAMRIFGSSNNSANINFSISV